jgi:hypothetical protein
MNKEVTTDTPRTDAARERYYDGKTSDWVHYTICRMIEQELAASQAEVDRLKGALIECLEITSIYDSNGDYETARDNVYDIAANALKTQDNK